MHDADGIGLLQLDLMAGLAVVKARDKWLYRG
jgi:hypothetical protein